MRSINQPRVSLQISDQENSFKYRKHGVTTVEFTLFSNLHFPKLYGLTAIVFGCRLYNQAILHLEFKALNVPSEKTAWKPEAQLDSNIFDKTLCVKQRILFHLLVNSF